PFFMVDLTALSDFSRSNCIGICAFLVPAMMLTTLQSLLFVLFQRRRLALTVSVGLGWGWVALMVGHVATWFSIGVVTPVTFILLTLASVCWLVNTGLWLGFGQGGDRPGWDLPDWAN
ncbi:MAG: hypothetical protein ACKO5Q_05740, partial [Microcystaceae cyanobacterium]